MSPTAVHRRPTRRLKTSVSTAHDEYTRRILDAVDSGRDVSQRSLSRQLDVALGLTNALLRRLVKKGFLRVLKVRANRVRYLITPAGIAEKARVTRAFFETTIKLYTETREQVRDMLAELSASLVDPANGGAAKGIVFYGTGDVAEIGYVSLHTTDLVFVGAVDDCARRSFMGHPVYSLADLTPGSSPSLAGRPFSRIIVMSIHDADLMADRLRALGFERDQIFLLNEPRKPS